MSQFDSSLRLFEAMDGLDDAFIQESMLCDTTAPSAAERRKRGQNLLNRVAHSGWTAAVLCAIVSLSVLVAIVRLGQGNMSGDVAPENNGPANSEVTDTAPFETDEPITLPEEADRVPARTVSVDEAGLRYVSNGDGTCVCMGFEDDAGQTVVSIPDYSPDGDVVTAVDPYAFRNSLHLSEVTLPAGLRSYDRNTFPMEAEIYHLYGNVLYLGTVKNPYMVAVATADNRPGATSLHPHTRLLADRALTYDSGSYFALKWKDTVPAYTDSPVFTIPSTVTYIGEYALLDVGRDITYNGYLVGWDALTAASHTDLIRTVDGSPVTVTCLDGTTQSRAIEIREVHVDARAAWEDGIFFGGYFTYFRGVNEDYYAWLKNPSDFAFAPDQFVTVSAVFGNESRVLTVEDLTNLRFISDYGRNEAVNAFIEAFNRDSAALYAGKSVVMVFLHETALYNHTVTDVTVTDGRIHVALACTGKDAGALTGERFILIPVDDPEGMLAGYAVSFGIANE